MITPSDDDYKDTKMIKQEKTVLSYPFNELSAWINMTYGVTTLNICYDLIKLSNNRPRLNIIFEHKTDEKNFRCKDGNYNKEIQTAIANKFQELIKIRDLHNKGIIKGLLGNKEKRQFDTKDIWVIFSSFEIVARIEANESIPEQKIEELKVRINNKDVWEIVRCFSYTTFFFYTDSQVEESLHNGIREKLTKEYYVLLKEYDEFNYFNEESFSIYLDSKENFDKNYQSSWFYYFK
jgi:hypothetical protein